MSKNGVKNKKETASTQCTPPETVEHFFLQPPSQRLVIIDDPPCSSWIIYRISPLNTHTAHEPWVENAADVLSAHKPGEGGELGRSWLHKCHTQSLSPHNMALPQENYFC